MSIWLNDYWEPTDLDTVLYMKHLERRDEFNIKSKEIVGNSTVQTLVKSSSDSFLTNLAGKTFGDSWKSDNEVHPSDIKTFGLYLGVNSIKASKKITIQAVECSDTSTCSELEEEVELEKEFRYWSNVDHWSDGRDADPTS